MLASSFKSHMDLHITAPTHKGLVETLALLESESLIHVDTEAPDFAFTYSADLDPKEDTTRPRGFNMEWDFCESACGTVACIGGWAALLTNQDPYEVVNCVDGNDDLEALFFPPDRLNWNSITPAQAAKALRHYLTTGVVDWDRALADGE